MTPARRVRPTPPIHFGPEDMDVPDDEDEDERVSAKDVERMGRELAASDRERRIQAHMARVSGEDSGDGGAASGVKCMGAIPTSVTSGRCVM